MGRLDEAVRLRFGATREQAGGSRCCGAGIAHGACAFIGKGEGNPVSVASRGRGAAHARDVQPVPQRLILNSICAVVVRVDPRGTGHPGEHLAAYCAAVGSHAYLHLRRGVRIGGRAWTHGGHPWHPSLQLGRADPSRAGPGTPGWCPAAPPPRADPSPGGAPSSGRRHLPHESAV